MPQILGVGSKFKSLFSVLIFYSYKTVDMKMFFFKSAKQIAFGPNSGANPNP